MTRWAAGRGLSPRILPGRKVTVQLLTVVNGGREWVLLVCGPGGEEKIFEGESAGRLAREPKGGAGFGYDPLFVPEGYEHSFAELGDAVKAGISHRARAWARLAEWVRGRA